MRAPATATVCARSTCCTAGPRCLIRYRPTSGQRRCLPSAPDLLGRHVAVHGRDAGGGANLRLDLNRHGPKAIHDDLGGRVVRPAEGCVERMSPPNSPCCELMVYESRCRHVDGIAPPAPVREQATQVTMPASSEVMYSRFGPTAPSFVVSTTEVTPPNLARGLSAPSKRGGSPAGFAGH